MRSFDRRFGRYETPEASSTRRHSCSGTRRHQASRRRSPRRRRRAATCTTARWRRSARVRDDANEADARRRCARPSWRLRAASSARHPTSGYCDNALWQAGNLAALTPTSVSGSEDRSQDRGAPLHAARRPVSRPASCVARFDERSPTSMRLLRRRVPSGAAARRPERIPRASAGGAAAPAPPLPRQPPVDTRAASADTADSTIRPPAARCRGRDGRMLKEITPDRRCPTASG